MNIAARLILGCALLAVAAPAAAQASAHDRLFQLFKNSDEAYLKRNPLQALYRGDYRYADRLGDLYSDAHFQGEKAAAERDLSALHAIPRGELGSDDRIAYDVFEFQTKDTLRSLQPDLLPLSEALERRRLFSVITGTAGDDVFYVRLSADQSALQVWNAASPAGAPDASYAASPTALFRSRPSTPRVKSRRRQPPGR